VKKAGLEQILIWEKAVEIHADIAELSVEKALSHLNNIDDLTPEIKQAAIKLINSGNQASIYIQKNFTPDFSLINDDIPDYKIGTILGEYELLEKLGQGGMSQVYKAKRLKSGAQKQVAIKIFSPQGHSLFLLENFINEQKILSELSHPNIVGMLHGDKTDDNTTYLVMELIDNALPINQYFKQSHATVDKKITFISQCANALSYSHANLIIHRDLKPDNILVDQNDKLKIVDFGIAKLISNDLTGNNTTIMALTPSYAAPEQINSEKISVTTDVFSLAVVALELLAGKQFLPQDRLIKSCINDEQAINGCLKSLKVDKDLKNILRQALQQNPQNRYASMQSFCNDLDNFLLQKPVNATAQSIYYRLKKFAHRRSALFATMVSLLVSLIIGLAVSLWQYQQIKIESGKAQQVKQFMLDTFNVTNPNISGGNEVSAKDLLRIAAVKLNDNSSMNPLIKFELYQSLAIANDQLGFSQEAIDLLKQSLKIKPNSTKSIAYLASNYLQANELNALEHLLSNTNETKFISEIDRAKFSLTRAKNLSSSGDSNKAIELINEIKNLNEVKESDIEIIAIQQVLAEIYYHKSGYDKSIKILKSILSQSDLSLTHTLILSTKLDLGRSYNSMGKHGLALSEFVEIESLYKQILGDKHPDLGRLYLRMSSSFKATGQIEKAHDYAQLSYDTNINVFGNKGSRVASSLNMLAVLSYTEGNLDKAIEFTDKAIKILEQSYDLNHPKILEIKTNLATLFGFKKQYNKSLDILNQVYAVQKDKLGSNNFATLNTEHNIINALTHLKQLQEAKKLALEHLQRVRNNFSPESILTINAYTSLAQIYLFTNEKQKRLKTLLATEKLKLLDESNPNYIITLTHIAVAYKNLDDIKKADEYFDKAFRLNTKIHSDVDISTLQLKLSYGNFLKNLKRTSELKNILMEVKKTIKQENYHITQLDKWIIRLEK